MNSKRYWKNRLPFLLTNLVCMAALTVFLLVCGNSVSAVVLILIVWALVLLTGLILTYWKRKRQMKKLLDMAEQLSERYLISEVMELPEQAEDQVYYQLLKMAGKSMLEQIGEVERERLEYKEYIEQWIHEIKTPITAMKSTRHFPACSHNFPKAGEARFQGLSRLFRLLGKFPYLGESRRILMAVSSKTSSKTRFYYAATRRISSAAVQPSIWA